MLIRRRAKGAMVLQISKGAAARRFAVSGPIKSASRVLDTRENHLGADRGEKP